MQRLYKSNAIKLALIAEMPPILCKDTVFLSHRQTSWIILTQTERKTLNLKFIPSITLLSQSSYGIPIVKKIEIRGQNLYSYSIVCQNVS